MATAGSTTTTSRYNYGVHFPESNGDGYLLVGPLSSGMFGVTALVVDTNGKIFVRKFEREASSAEGHEIHAPEVRNYFTHTNIPELISYKVTSHGNDNFKTTTTQKFCNGGTLNDTIGPLKRLTREQLLGEGWNIAPRLPEIWIFLFLERTLSVFIEMFNRGIVHRDFHEENIFLHWESPTATIPEVYIGDLGLSMAWPLRHHPRREFRNPFEIDRLNHLLPPPLPVTPFMSVGSRVHFNLGRTQPESSESAITAKTLAANWFANVFRDVTRLFWIFNSLIGSSPEQGSTLR